jgi:protein-S-isoprenylcysteine O-methyltransferase Ste14
MIMKPSDIAYAGRLIAFAILVLAGSVMVSFGVHADVVTIHQFWDGHYLKWVGIVLGLLGLVLIIIECARYSTVDRPESPPEPK